MSKPIVVRDLKTLRKVVLSAINEHGPSVDLNHVDVGGVNSFNGLFKDTEFCGNVSKWDMSNAEFTNEMFANTPFNGDISKWNIKKLTQANGMFKNSLFNGHVDQWNPSILVFGQINSIFENSAFAQNLTAWHITDKCEQFERRTAELVKTYPLPTRIPTNEALREHCVTVYTTMFGGEQNLQKYFMQTPFGVMHFDVCCVSQSCPAGVAPEDFEWSREMFSMGTGLGLNNVELRKVCVSQLGTRGDKELVAVSLAGMDL